jgi:uncharacterized protein YkwD
MLSPRRDDEDARRVPPGGHGTLAAVLALVVALLAPQAGAAEPEAVCATELERQVLVLVNAERAALGRPPLALDVRLGAAARRHAEDMRDGCFLSHTGSDGSSAFARMADAGYAGGMGEVAAAGSWPYPPQSVVNSWMNSAGHRAILVDSRARHLGMGYAARVPGCPLQGHGFQAGGFWAGTTGNAPDSEFLDERCCATPGGPPLCVPEPGAAAGGAAGALALAVLRARRRVPGSRPRA